MVARIADKSEKGKQLSDIERFFDMLYTAKNRTGEPWVTNAEFANAGMLRYAVHKHKLKTVYGVDVKVLDPIFKGGRIYRYILGDN